MSCLDHIVKPCMERILDFYIAPPRTELSAAAYCFLTGGPQAKSRTGGTDRRTSLSHEALLRCSEERCRTTN